MKLIKFPEQINNENNNPVVVVLGKFESIHLGHRELILEARKKSTEINGELLIMLFSQRKNKNFYSMEERIMFLKEYNPDYILEFEPNANNFALSYKKFNEYLKSFNTQHVVCGHDFKYGSNREGNVSTLEEEFNVIKLNELKFNNKSVRTSNIYDSLMSDDLNSYKEMMGHYFFYKGKVVKGKGNGKKFGMPTANVEYPKYKIDINEGIYYSYVIYDGQRLPSLTSISNNPTLDAKEITYETYIYNFDKDIYGEEIYVELIDKYRDPIKFNSIDELIEALQEDKKLGEKYFNLR